MFPHPLAARPSGRWPPLGLDIVDFPNLRLCLVTWTCRKCQSDCRHTLSLNHASRRPVILCRFCAAAVLVPSPWEYPRGVSYQSSVSSRAGQPPVREVWATAAVAEEEADPFGEALVAVVDNTLSAARGLGTSLASGSRKGKGLLQEAARYLRRIFNLRSRKR